MQFKNNYLTIVSLIFVVYYVRTKSVNIRITNTTIIIFILSFCFVHAVILFVALLFSIFINLF